MILRRALIRGGQLIPSAARCTTVRTYSTTTTPEPDPPPHLHGQPQQQKQPYPRRPIAGYLDTLQDQVEFFKNFKSTTGKLGARVGPHYHPNRLTNHPPFPQDVTLELLLAAGAHLGHATALWNPGNQRYIFGVRQGIHIISLEQTAAHLRRAARVVEGVVFNGGLVLFVGSRQGQDRCVVEAARRTGGCHLFEKWIPGTITNGRMIVGHGAVVEMDFADRPNPEGPIAGGGGSNGEGEGVGPLVPDLVVCLNPPENYILLHECGLHGIPTIGVVDTDADPTWVTYPIPANDDSLRCVQLIAGVLGRAGESGRLARIQQTKMREQMRPLEEAEAGQYM